MTSIRFWGSYIPPERRNRAYENVTKTQGHKNFEATHDHLSRHAAQEEDFKEQLGEEFSSKVLDVINAIINEDFNEARNILCWSQSAFIHEFFDACWHYLKQYAGFTNHLKQFIIYLDFSHDLQNVTEHLKELVSQGSIEFSSSPTNLSRTEKGNNKSESKKQSPLRIPTVFD